MDISMAELDRIVKTLPIGFYAKRRVVAEIGETDKTSYYSPNTDNIVISYPQICTSLSKFPNDSPHKERIIRGILYHEVSHAFMTPDMWWSDVINVFEDERMETLLANYYHNVDFKSNVFLFNGLEVGKVPTATTHFEVFYNLVRFRYGEPEKLAKVKEIIETYKGINKLSGFDEWRPYYHDIYDLYEDIEATSVADAVKSSSFQIDVCPDDKGEPKNSEDEPIDIDVEGVGRQDGDPLDNDTIKQMFTDVVGGSTSKELLDFFQAIIDTFNKRNSGGSAIGGYSGVLNPRSVGNPEWKIFDRSFSQQSSNAYGTLHLNLFIDRSGSFSPSEKIVNKILSALSQIEKRNPIFTLDVVFCGNGEKVVGSPKERVIRCMGGNDLDNAIFDIYKSLQKPSTYNYNIVLFDGDAFTDGNRSHYKNFRAFDFNNCTIISDRANERYIAPNVHKAKVIYTKDYTAELMHNLKTVLARAFR